MDVHWVCPSMKKQLGKECAEEKWISDVRVGDAIDEETATVFLCLASYRCGDWRVTGGKADPVSYPNCFFFS
jgi:hypothetical protein